MRLKDFLEAVQLYRGFLWQAKRIEGNCLKGFFRAVALRLFHGKYVFGVVEIVVGIV